MLSKLKIPLNILFIATVLLFTLDNSKDFDIKNQAIKSIVYIGLLIETPLILIYNFFIFKTQKEKAIGTIFPALIVIAILIIGPLKIYASINAWKTQTILYKNSHSNSKTIEFQMQKSDALGYNMRTVEVMYLTNLFMIIKEVPIDIDKRVEWIKVNQDMNELKIK
ncbi:MAG TPA: hypothetical protein VK766_03270 [Cytophagaceae bacterium]|jgi:hypothetical protein|nr:hypothetical protein [Cytophagaceae bacterium]